MVNLQSIAVGRSTVPTTEYPVSRTDGGAFAEILKNSSDNKQAIPNKWCSDTDKFGSGVEKAVKYMRENLGINPYDRIPTYKITDEQIAWLKSRHDLDDIYKTASEVSEDGRSGWTMSWWDENFLSDLVYLNVISPEDAKSFGWIAFPGSESGKVYAAGDSGSGSGTLSITDIAAKVLGKQQSHIDSICAKYNNNLSLITKEDIEYLETAQTLLEKNQIWYDILSRLSD